MRNLWDVIKYLKFKIKEVILKKIMCKLGKKIYLIAFFQCRREEKKKKKK